MNRKEIIKELKEIELKVKVKLVSNLNNTKLVPMSLKLKLSLIFKMDCNDLKKFPEDEINY
jgi:hypothetical protein